MTAAPARDRDGLLALAALVGAIASAALLLLEVPLPFDPKPKPSARAPVARLERLEGTVRRRPADTLGWQDSRDGEPVLERDALFVPPGGDARLIFNDGSVLELEASTLVVVELPEGARGRVSVRKGSIATLAGRAGLELATPFGAARLSPEAQARLSVEPQNATLEVTAGRATLEGKAGRATLEAGSRSALTREGVTALAPWPVTLTAPGPGFRRFFRGAPPSVELAWSGAAEGARLQVARDRLFTFVATDVDGASGQATFTPSQAGIFWWRVVSARGEGQSEARKLTLLEDVPPQLSLPGANATVQGTAQVPVLFSWGQVRGVSRYTLEVAASPGFEAVVFTETLEGTQVRARLTLDEGTWYWRVRAAEADRGDSGASASRAFRLIHKPIIEAPELLAPQIEVGAEGP